MFLDADHWQEIWESVRHNKLRTLLTAFGVFWGIFMLMLMLGTGSGLGNGVDAGFSDIATNSFFVWTRQTSVPYGGLPAGRRFEMNNDDFVALQRMVPEAEIISPRLQLGGYSRGNNVTRGRHSGGFSVMGDYPQIRQIQSLKIVEGRFINPLDIAERRKVAVLGSRVREVLFKSDENPIGDSIEVNGVYFNVIGVFTSPKSGEEADRDAQTVYVPFTTFQTTFNYRDEIGWLAITSQPGIPASQVESKVLQILRARHRVAPSDRRALGHWNMEEQYNKIRGLFSGINLLVWIVGTGTLSAGVIGVSNIMLIIVKERTREIGIRRAVGANPLAVTSQIVLESVVLTAIAGYLGLVAGIALIEAVRLLLETTGANLTMFQNPEVDLATALRALALLVASGVVAGLMPAYRAMKINPVKALHAG